MAKILASFIVLLVTWAFAITYYVDVVDLARQDKMVVEVLLVFLGIVLLIRTVITIKDFVRLRAEEQEEGKEKAVVSSAFGGLLNQKQVTFFGVTVPYVALFPFLGFFVSSFLYVLVLNVLLGTRGKLKLIGIPAALTVLSYLLFVLALGIRLPRGLLF